MQDPTRFETLVAILDRLRDPGGCPWDREQTFESLRSYLIEETYEVAEALDRDDRTALREELGDLLLQVVFLSRLAKEEGAFDAGEVVRGIVDKMIRRHPHVFGDETASTSEEVLRNWEEIKRREKGAAKNAPRSVLSGIPKALPALVKAQRLGTKAARVGFDWERADDVLDKIREELGELTEAVGGARHEDVREELGDLLFATAQLARKLDIDPEQALERTNHKFVARFERVERALAADGVAPADAGLDRLERLWREAKSRDR